LWGQPTVIEMRQSLAHDPKDRYPSAGVLAQDIANYLTGEPLAAKRPTTAYFLRKRIWKYRVPVAIACSVLATLLGMGVFAYLRVVQERSQAIAARDGLRKEVDKAKEMYGFLLRVLTWADPESRTILIRESLDQEAKAVANLYASQPEIEAGVRTSIGLLYMFLDQDDAAEMQFRSALELRGQVLGEEHSDTLFAKQALAEVLWRKGKHDEAEAMFRHGLEIGRRTLPEEPVTLCLMNRVAVILEQKGELAEAEALRRQSLDIQKSHLGKEHPDTLKAMNNLAALLRGTGKLDEAEALNRQILEIRRSVQGDEHPDTLWARSNLAGLLEQRGQLPEPVSETKYKVLAYDGFEGKLSVDWKIGRPDPSHF